MSVAQYPPAWVERIRNAWDDEQGPGQPLLALLISKWAQGPFADNDDCKDGEGCLVLRLREPSILIGDGFQGHLEVHVVSGSMEFKFHDSDGGEWVLQPADPVAFHALLVEELNR